MPRVVGVKTEVEAGVAGPGSECLRGAGFLFEVKRCPSGGDSLLSGIY